MTTLSPALIGLAANFGVGECGAAHVRQRRLLADDLRTPCSGSARIFAQLLILIRVLIERDTPPEIELRVVSLPPTISRIRLPRNSFGGMFRVDGEWASIEIRSLPGSH